MARFSIVILDNMSDIISLEWRNYIFILINSWIIMSNVAERAMLF